MFALRSGLRPSHELSVLFSDGKEKETEEGAILQNLSAPPFPPCQASALRPFSLTDSRPFYANHSADMGTDVGASLI